MIANGMPVFTSFKMMRPAISAWPLNAWEPPLRPAARPAERNGAERNGAERLPGPAGKAACRYLKRT